MNEHPMPELTDWQKAVVENLLPPEGIKIDPGVWETQLRRRMDIYGRPKWLAAFIQFYGPEIVAESVANMAVRLAAKEAK